MKRVAVLLVLTGVGLARPGWADKFRDDLDKLTAGLPKDAAAIVTRHVVCNHWQGEEPYDRSRAKQIDRALKQNRCDSLDRDEAALRARLRDRPEIIKALDDAANF